MKRAESPQRVLTRLRRICLALPDACETLTWDHPNFRAGKKIFAAFHADSEETLCIWVKLGPGASEMARDDERFSQSRHGAGYWVGLRADRPLDWDVVKGLLLASFRATALKSSIRKLGDVPTWR